MTKITFSKEYILVGLIIIFTFFIRIYKINTDLLYHRDQGLVAMDIYKIWHDKKISLLGAPTDVDGLFHSPIYYWGLTPFYWLGKGDIVYPAIFQIFLEILSLPFLYMAIKKLFNKNTAFLTLIFYAVSYGLISYSRWFITVPFILPLTNLFLFTLVFKKSIFINALLVGMITQTNAAVGIFYLPFIFFHCKKQLSIKNILIILFGFILPATPLIIFQFRHDFITLRTILSYLGNSTVGLGFSLGIFWKNLVIYLKEINHLILYPYLLISTAILIYGLSKIKKEKRFVYSYLIIPFLFLGLFQRGAISFFYIAALPLTLAVLAFGILNLPKLFKFVTILIILLLNLFLIKNVYKPNNALIPIGDRNVITLQDRKNIIDWVYEKSNGKEFSLWIYTLPYFQDYPWEYLFLTYAKDKYDYLPERSGSFSPNDLKTSVHFFNVYEVDHDNLSRQDVWFGEVEKNFGETVDSFSSNDIHVELREKIK